MEGKVKFYDEKKGYGFLIVEGEGDYFVHITNIVGKVVLEEGQNVSFDTEDGEKGPKAVNVKVIEEE